MLIAICGSMSFAKEMLECAEKLEKMGHTCLLPKDTEGYAKLVRTRNPNKRVSAKRKIKLDLIRKHAKCVDAADAILVVNYQKDDVVGYIGGNTLIEMGYAYITDKKIFLLYDIPDTPLIEQEVIAVEPIVIHGNLSLIPLE